MSGLFSSRSFTVSRLTIGSLIHFEFIFVYGVRKCCNFIFLLLHVAVQFSQHHLLKILFFSPLHNSCLLCHRLIGHMWVDLFLGFLSSSVDLCVCFVLKRICRPDSGNPLKDSELENNWRALFWFTLLLVLKFLPSHPVACVERQFFL